MAYAEFLSPSKIRIAAPCYCRPIDLPRTLKDSRSIGVIMSLQIHTAVIHGIIWSALWAAMVAVSLHRFPWTIAHDYPADVIECAHILQPSVNQKRLAIVFFVCVFFAAPVRRSFRFSVPTAQKTFLSSQFFAICGLWR